MNEYNKRALQHLTKVKAKLVEMTEGCALDMHEPDSVTAMVTGNYLDNAMGAQPFSGEYCVRLTQDNGSEWFNLADLIALARLADVE